jgi:hypothetical protein
MLLPYLEEIGQYLPEKILEKNFQLKRTRSQGFRQEYLFLLSISQILDLFKFK